MSLIKMPCQLMIILHAYAMIYTNIFPFTTINEILLFYKMICCHIGLVTNMSLNVQGKNAF